MRVIAGERKGLKLASIKKIEMRPTLDRVKETLFNVINNELYNADFLDIFAGSGQIAIEALSRYAKHAFIIENSKDSLKIIDENIKKSKYEEKISIMNKPAIEALKNLCKDDKSFDIIFADPPYAYKEFKDLINALIDSKILKEKGILIIEHDKKIDISQYLNLEYFIYKEKNFSASKLSFIKNIACKE